MARTSSRWERAAGKAIVLAAAILSAPSWAQSPAMKGPLAIDVAGVRLGMPLAAAEAALAGTYRCERFGRMRSFRQTVDRQVAERRGAGGGFGPEGDGWAEVDCDGPSGEYLRLFLAQVRSGDVVDRIDMAIPTDRVDLASIVRQVAAKFGPPTEGTPANGSWCAGRCVLALPDKAGPRIDTQSLKSFRILGDRGGAARAADEAAVRSAVDAAAPPKTRGAF